MAAADRDLEKDTQRPLENPDDANPSALAKRQSYTTTRTPPIRSAAHPA
jgi:hypothetical protein